MKNNPSTPIPYFPNKDIKVNYINLENPAGLYSKSLDDIINIAKKHLDENSGNFSSIDYFKDRYTYKNNLIIVHQEAQKAFYDHYPPKKLINIAAPKIFTTANDCINWVKAGLDRNQTK